MILLGEQANQYPGMALFRICLRLVSHNRCFDNGYAI